MSNEIAEHFFKSAEEFIQNAEDQEDFIAILDQVEEQFPEDVTILYRSAKLLFHYGVINNKKRFYLLALDKIKLAKEKDVSVFEYTAFGFQLWGNILVEIGKLLNNSSFFNLALEKYERAEQATSTPESDLFWDTGEAWVFLSQKSGELSDLQKALQYFHLAHNYNLRSPFFLLDYATTLCLYGKLNGNPSFVEEAITLYQHILLDTYSPKEETFTAYTIGWRKLALAMKLRFELTHSKQHFLEADTVFRDAILSSPKNGELWIEWGALFLMAGWLKKDFDLIEEGFDKLTSPKIKECDPLKASYLLSLGLAFCGLFLDSLKLLRDSQEHARIDLEVYQKDSYLRFAFIFSELSVGIYFSDEHVFKRVVTFLEQEICHTEELKLESLHVLFQTYMAWGMKSKEILLIQKGLFAISRLCELRPFSPIFLNEWGIALVDLQKIDVNQANGQAYLEEAIDKFKKANHLWTDAETFYNLGGAFYCLGHLSGEKENYEEAIHALVKACEMKPYDLQICHRLGLAYSHLGKLTMNIKHLLQAIDLLNFVSRIEIDNGEIFCDLGYTFLIISELLLDTLSLEEKSQKKHAAEKALIRAVELGSEHAFYYLANLYSLSNLYAISLHYLRKAKEANNLPSVEILEQDKWLEGVRTTAEYQTFLKKMRDENG